MLKELILLCIFICIGMMIGKLVTKIKLPAILGWLLTGMMIGPYALGWLNNDILDSSWFHIIINIGEITAGLMIGTELIWKEIKKSGKQILTICLTEAFGAFILVSLAFSVIFMFMDIPVYLSVVFGSIALATAPAPSLSIVNEYNTKGAVTKTLIPLAALDDIVAIVVFFSVIGLVTSITSGGGSPLYYIPLMIIIPIILGCLTGFLSSFILKKEMNKKATILSVLGCILVTASIGIFINSYVLTEFSINLMIMGTAFAATFSNLMSKERLHQLVDDTKPMVALTMVILIINLGAPLDYSLILGAGLFTAIYIIARAIGKLGGSYIGAVISKAPTTVKKYLGLTLLPHSGVSLIFTGIAVNTLIKPAPEYAQIIQGTIAAAAVINEIIAVILAKQGFKLAGELNHGAEKDDIQQDFISEEVSTNNRQEQVSSKVTI
ncbi:cation:proton antiporter [Turicibacter sanguinis]|uniref:cation:proton antiporter n=1 Tax=Turicibacter sanguinis TaxID=154288 RepID=UPI0018AAA54F|nr:cation:proton antiporter [Turicibacter sanguinis]MDB8553551.1 cation:proton antiporter [Turicibacter sanguinis]